MAFSVAGIRMVGLACLATLLIGSPASGAPSELVRRELSNAKTEPKTEHCLLPIVDAIYYSESLLPKVQVDSLAVMLFSASITSLRNTKWDTTAPDDDFRSMITVAEQEIAKSRDRIEEARAGLREDRRELHACESSGEELGCAFLREAVYQLESLILGQEQAIETQRGFKAYSECVLTERGR